jgi:uncharacterized protein YbcV (DUF1398 family)
MASQLKIQKDMEQHFKPKKNDKYLKECREEKYDTFIDWLQRENSVAEFLNYIHEKRGAPFSETN